MVKKTKKTINKVNNTDTVSNNTDVKPNDTNNSSTADQSDNAANRPAPLTTKERLRRIVAKREQEKAFGKLKDTLKADTDPMAADDRAYAMIISQLQDPVNKQLFIALISVVCEITGEDFRRMCSRLEVKPDKIQSITVTDGENSYAISIVKVSSDYETNINEVKELLTPEGQKQLTDIIDHLILRLRIYYECLRRGYAEWFESLSKRITNAHDFDMIKISPTTTLYLTENGPHMGIVLTPIPKNIANELMEGSKSYNEVTGVSGPDVE
jgi:hypothetical protein